jgi:predicted PhzF superfamily epimerase YddE/YHI9
VTTLHVLRVFVGPGGRGGNPLGIFVDGSAIAEDERQAVAADLGFSETVFVDAIADGTAPIAIYTPAVEMPFAGHPTVGTSWLLRRLGHQVDTLRPPAGDVPTWQDANAGLTWIRAKAAWASSAFRVVEYATAAEVEALQPPRLGDPGFYAWAWLDAGSGELRARSFPTEFGIVEDEATGLAAVLMGARLGRALTIRQGVGSELHVRPGPEGTVDVGGRCGFLEERAYKA